MKYRRYYRIQYYNTGPRQYVSPAKNLWLNVRRWLGLKN